MWNSPYGYPPISPPQSGVIYVPMPVNPDGKPAPDALKELKNFMKFMKRMEKEKDEEKKKEKKPEKKLSWIPIGIVLLGTWPFWMLGMFLMLKSLMNG